jgi:hypothetical protein
MVSAAQQKWLAAHLPTCRIWLAPMTDGPFMLAWHDAPMDGSGCNVEPWPRTAIGTLVNRISSENSGSKVPPT